MYKLKKDNLKIELPINLNFNVLGFDDILINRLEELTYNNQQARNNIFNINDLKIFFYFKPKNITSDYKKVVNFFQDKNYYNSFYPQLDVKEESSTKKISNNIQFFYKNTFNINLYNKSYFRFRYYDSYELNILLKEEKFNINSLFFDTDNSDLPIVLEHEESLVYGNTFIKTEFFKITRPILNLSSNNGYFFTKNFINNELYLIIDFFNPLTNTFISFIEQNNETQTILKVQITDKVNFLQLNNGNWVINNNYNLFEL